MSPILKITGARQNNLKNLSLELPLETLVCITGPSGSGKSSLAFDTIYAEGQRRYVESLNTYARQFFEKLPRPDIDAIENICPAIALQQKNPVKNSRSTVGTSTEVYDYLRLFFSKLGETFCPKCGKKIEADTPSSAADQVLSLLDQKTDRGYIGFYWPEGTAMASHFIEKGYLRRLKSEKNWEALSFEDNPKEMVSKKSLIVFDRLQFSKEERMRMVESLEGCFREGKGEAFLVLLNQKKFFRFSSDFKCSSCDIEVAKKTPLLFSFNSPLGACSECKGFGNKLEYDETLIVPYPRQTLDGGALDPFTKPMMKNGKKRLFDFLKKEKVPLNIPWADLTKEQKKTVLSGVGKYKGAIGELKKKEEKLYKLHVRVFIRRYQSAFTCPLCGGSRLRSDALCVKVSDKNIRDLVLMPLDALHDWFLKTPFSKHDRLLGAEVLRQLQSRLQFLVRMGLGYLTLNRLSKTLSGGESQRINLANQLGAELSGTLYVLDEPSIGLHAKDRDRLLESLDELVALGNSVFVVEHDLATIQKATHVLELGPLSGPAGGNIVFQGSQKDFLKADTITAKYLRNDDQVFVPKERRPKADQWLSIQGASENNLKEVNLNLPLKRLIGVSGVSGSGKSTLFRHTLFNALARIYLKSTESIGKFKRLFGSDLVKGVLLLDQSPIGRSTRSIPLSVLGGYDEVRHLFAATPRAKRNKIPPGHFSFNVSGGRCETCMGEGVVKTEMYFMDDLYLICEECEGRRFKKSLLQIRYKDKNINEVLDLTVDQAKLFFEESTILEHKLTLLQKVGLGYLKIGQSTGTLSGGESQRLKIASEMLSTRKRNQIYIMDEPTTGLHIHEIKSLIGLLQELVDQGNTVVVIEHQLDVLKCCDWIIDLGPGAGDQGGNIVGEGSPEEIAKLKTPTGIAMKNTLAHSSFSLRDHA